MTVLEEKMKKEREAKCRQREFVGHKSIRETELTRVRWDPERAGVGKTEREKGIREGMKRQSVGGKKTEERAHQRIRLVIS